MTPLLLTHFSIVGETAVCAHYHDTLFFLHFCGHMFCVSMNRLINLMFSRNKKRKATFRQKFILACISSGLFLGGGLFLWAANLQMPDLSAFDERRVNQSTKIYDRTGETLLYDIHENVKRTVVPFEEISRHVKNATVAIEDSEFYEHRGVKPTAFLRALLVNLATFEFSQGGSTITQQVVKNSIL